jgi:phosphate transport system permease protein
VATRTSTAQDVVFENLKGKKSDWKSWVFQGLLLFMLLFSFLILLTLLAEVFSGGFGVLKERGGDFLGTGVSSLPERAGVYQGIIGSFLMMAFVIIVSFPLGIGAAVYLEEYAPNTRFSRFVNVNIRNLAGVPSVVYGLLGLVIFVELLAGFTGGRSIIAGGLTLAVLVLPIVIITSAEALRAVPASIREAGFGVGATRWEVVRSHVLPSAAPGILTGCVLSISRALGETAPLLLVGAVTGFLASGSLYEQLYSEFTSMPTIIFAWSKEPDPAFRELMAAAIIVLLAVILVANATAIVLRNRYEKKW